MAMATRTHTGHVVTAAKARPLATTVMGATTASTPPTRTHSTPTAQGTTTTGLTSTATVALHTATTTATAPAMGGLVMRRRATMGTRRPHTAARTRVRGKGATPIETGSTCRTKAVRVTWGTVQLVVATRRWSACHLASTVPTPAVATVRPRGTQRTAGAGIRTSDPGTRRTSRTNRSAPTIQS